ncbi:BglG family transcription antiterminator [Brevibacillus laterosporus]|uniref:BglG family transcription antiterminator n=1 Tax=Brevibacillus laterosporus TaxID=1465 RepID=UPI0013871C25|nr:BglG family transcription antiterminator [Brevibacillus laterosporus]MED2006243.1 BglG family transcription antiterminator [Brevibacillus laterosporus]MED4766233.1 BglG family transcription antiterminator [Brevibacillus laterosporus]
MMYLDERGTALLQEVLKNPNISNQRLGEKFQLSRRQVIYSFEKINEWLIENNYSVIEKTNSGNFLIDPNLTLLFAQKKESNKKIEYVPTQNERKNLILLMILSSEDLLSIPHFTSTLRFSTATIMRDIKNLQYELTKEDLEVHYTRQEGYQIIGNEWEFRRKMIEVITEVFQMPFGEDFIQQCALVSKEEIHMLYKQIELIEKQLNLKFTDEKFFVLPYIINILVKRIKSGKNIDSEFLISSHELADTKEYRAVEFLLEKVPNVAIEERLFMTLQLLTSNISFQSILTENKLPQLENALYTSLTLFEKQALVYFKNKDELVEKLIIHMKPAYYRIKYNLNIDNNLPNTIHQEFESLYQFVNQSIWPLEDFIGATVPDSEIYYITLLIGGYLIRTNSMLQQPRRTAVTICSNGVTISKLMENQLMQLFPELHFYPTTSIRDFERNRDEVDIVFSVKPVETNSMLYLVEHYMEQEELLILRNRVMQDISNRSISLKDEKNQLQHLLYPEMIQIVDSINSWDDALTIASAPLLEEGFIEPSYVDSMKSLYPHFDPYIVLKGNILLPHARPENGVKKLGLSLLIVKDGIPFKKNKIHIIVVVAPSDKKSHLSALLELTNISSNQVIIDKLKNAENVKEVYQCLQKY